MGRLLQIRVSASTFSPDDVETAWPWLCALVWTKSPAGGVAPDRGVLQLVRGLDDGRRFGAWSEEARKRLDVGIDAAVHLADRLERALGDWNPTLANRLSEELENLLDDLERQALKFRQSAGS